MIIRIVPNDKGNPPGKLADAELHFTEGKRDERTTEMMDAVARLLVDREALDKLLGAVLRSRRPVVVRSVNPTANKALHIGHMRGACLGSAQRDGSLSPCMAAPRPTRTHDKTVQREETTMSTPTKHHPIGRRTLFRGTSSLAGLEAGGIP